MILLEAPTGVDVFAPALAITGVTLVLGVLGWWLGVGSGKGAGER